MGQCSFQYQTLGSMHMTSEMYSLGIGNHRTRTQEAIGFDDEMDGTFGFRFQCFDDSEQFKYSVTQACRIYVFLEGNINSSMHKDDYQKKFSNN